MTVQYKHTMSAKRSDIGSKLQAAPGLKYQNGGDVPKLLRIDRVITGLRTFKLLSKEDYGIPRTAMVKRWKLLTEGLKATVCVNGVALTLDGLDGINFDIKAIRYAMREMVPGSREENMICAAESTLFGAQLVATEYYRYFPSDQLFDLLFTGTLAISFECEWIDGGDEDIPSAVEMEEEYVLSETHLLQRIKQGETLEQIELNKDPSANVEL